MKTFNIVLAVLFLLSMGFLLGYTIGPSDGNLADPRAGSDVTFELPLSQASQVAGHQDSDDVSASRKTAITKAVAAVSPAVVGINVIAVREYQDPFSQFFGDDPIFRRFFGDRSYRQPVKGIGSGFVVSPDGYIVTNDHVAGNATEITVTMTNGEKLKARLVGTDPVTDIALLKVEEKNLPSLKLGDSDDIVIGEWAIAFGNPFGLFEINDKPTVTVGVISSTGMNLGRIEHRLYQNMIETDAAINGGNSGGPLVNSFGEVIGVNTLIFTGGQSSTFVGYGFAIPINRVKKVIAELKKSGKIERDVYAGFDAQTVDIRVARYFGLERPEGVIITELDRNGPAAKSGLQVGDIVFAINEQKIHSESDVESLLYDAKPGDSWKLTVLREKKMVPVTMVLGRR